MAINTLISEVTLDVYDHDTTPQTIKTIALDNKTRFVHAYLQSHGTDVYQPDLTATVTLTALRPDKVAAEVTGSVIELVPAGEDPAIYGLEAEITQAMIAVQGVVLFQFKMERGNEVLRTEIFRSNNGRALDGEASSWADEYQGYNLDELVQKTDFMGTLIDQALAGTVPLDRAILETHRYTERYINGRLSVENNGIRINTPGAEGEEEEDERVWICDDTLTVAGAAADAKVTGDKIRALQEDLNAVFESGNNLFAISGNYSNTYHGLTISIENGIITLSATKVTAANYLKLTNGYAIQTSEQTSWQNETVDFFEVGKTYSIGYKVIRGTMPSTIGTPFRYNKTSVLSGSIPVAKISDVPQYAQLYVPYGTKNLDVSFIPYVVEGYVATDFYDKTLSQEINVSDKKTPEQEFNYFTVEVNSFVPPNTSNATVNQDNENNMVNTQCVVTFPRSYSITGKPTPIIMYCHGRTDTVEVDNWVENNTDRLALVRSFTSAGFAVFDVDSTNHTSNVDVGCPQLMEGYRKAYEYIKENYNVEDRFFIYSYSFGTFPALNMLAWNPSLVKTACLSAVRASIKAVFDRGTPFNQEIAQKFGFVDTSGETYEADKLFGYDMYADMVYVDGTDRINVKIPPIKVLTSDADTLELTQAHTFINALKNGGNSVTHREVSGLTHVEMCLLKGGGLKDEVIMWFNRFR